MGAATNAMNWLKSEYSLSTPSRVVASAAKIAAQEKMWAQTKNMEYGGARERLKSEMIVRASC